MNINIIVAYCKNNGIGFQNKMPWHIKSDLKKFQKLTTGTGNNAVIMGKNTYNSILNNNKNGLKNRDNLILSTSLSINKTTDNNDIIKSFNSIQNLETFIKTKNYNELWIIGGTQIYDLFLNNYPVDGLLNPGKIYITYIDENFECDSFFPKIDNLKYKFISQEIHNNLKDSNNYSIIDIIYLKT
tara:strand:- start:1465 stop:2019 length:555 start_codon:yes stop_codon:yes gene_type:complete